MDSSRISVSLDLRVSKIDSLLAAIAVDSGQWTVDSGQWTVDSGQWTVDSGQWTVDSGQWTVA